MKELLSDPDVRHRLLASLQQERASGAGGSLSWLDWVRRPAGLAFAVGLAAVALAVVLGVRIYQDSLRQAAQSVATEEAKPASRPATPQAGEPQAKAKELAAPAIDFPKKDMLIDKPAAREWSAPLPSRKSEAPMLPATVCNNEVNKTKSAGKPTRLWLRSASLRRK